ncbi:nitrate transporter [Trifolium pratense]|uniref:Nitrate transporter n=1 Tax=Trifolium pratense TaxID=57577 RepID=A0A2K3L2M0_TRIPR|nr:nitrate transporter [Trifolium pratense]
MSSLELELSKENKFMEESESEELTLDGSVDFNGRPAIRAKSGRWGAGIIILYFERRCGVRSLVDLGSMACSCSGHFALSDK